MTPAGAARKIYDRGYFDKWYRSARHAVNTRDELQRKVALAVAAAEYYLGRRIRNVLDVGCGEGVWRKPLQSLRRGVDYLGLDSSEYAVARYGRARNIRLATFGQLGELRFDTTFDLIVCSDVLHYVPTPELKAGPARHRRDARWRGFPRALHVAGCASWRQARFHSALAKMVSLGVRASRVDRLRHALLHRAAPPGLRRRAREHLIRIESAGSDLTSDCTAATSALRLILTGS